ncbi:MAG TPA: dihydrolipoamide acetyltransferase family protein [Actinomycetota bacterium]|nr:dihydrolipoamide acetyltransferase family protein [Actinomycetota bacterium]
MREIVMPKSSMTMTEGELTKWLKSDGDPVADGDAVAEIMTDKVEMEVEAPSDGTLGILVPEGSTVAVGTPIAVVLAEGEAKPAGGGTPAASGATEEVAEVSEQPPAAGAGTPSASSAPPVSAEASTASASRPQAQPASSPTEEASASGDGDGKLRATPAARAMARRVGVDLAEVQGSGPRGRIKSDDVAAVAKGSDETPAPVADGLRVSSRERPRGVRGAMARHMAAAASIPQFTLFADVTMAAADAARRELEGISLTDMIVKATALALREHPEMNAHFVDGEVVRFESINIGLAVDTPRGLVVPVIKDANGDLSSIGIARAELADAARLGRLRPDEIEGGTFTITNLGMFGIDVFQPVIDPPRVGILSVGRMRGDAGRTATLGLAGDHRAVDGAQAARFLQTLTRYLERPDRYLL